MQYVFALQVVNLHYFVPLEERLLNDHASGGNEGPLLMMCRKKEVIGIEKKPMPYSVLSSISVEAMFVSGENIEK